MRPRGLLAQSPHEAYARRHAKQMLRRFYESAPPEYLEKTYNECMRALKDDGQRLHRQMIPVLDGIVESPSSKSHFVVMRGPKGTGKSTLAVAMAREVVGQKQLSGLFTTATSLFRDMSFSGIDGNPLTTKAREVDVLVIDDLGVATDRFTETQRQLWWELIDYRWSRRSHLTIMTTNMAIRSTGAGIGLAEWMGESAWDRVVSRLALVELSGQSLRGQM